VLGQLFESPVERRREPLLRIGLACIAAFVVLRAINMYGDPVPWSHQRTSLMTVLSFLNTTKYPPSLLFLLMTLGPSLLVLRALDGGTPSWLKPALTFGQVPLFYFLIHLPLIHLVAVGVALVRYGSAHWMLESPDLANYPFIAPPGWGLSLPAVYLAWVLIVAALYPVCAWYAKVKRSRPKWWMSYL
jgi:uncharacterized membrane protein